VKRKQIVYILILSLVFIAVTIIISYIIEAHSQKLPAVINSDRVFVSSEVEGILRQYLVSSMQEVAPNDPIAEVANSSLAFNLQTVKNEKRKYEELINSAQSGDQLKTELYRLDEDIQKNQNNLEEAKLVISKVREKINFMSERYASSKKKYDANKLLYDKGILNNPDFEQATKDFWDVHNEYYELKGDSLIASETVKSSQNIIDLLKARKKILSSNVDILASNYLIDLNNVEANINNMQAEIQNLKVYSPIAGIVTDINYRPGERIGKGDVIAEIADLSNVWVIAYGTSFSRHTVKIGQKVKIYCSSGEKVWGKVVTVSPVMEKVTSLSTSYETANTYTKIEIKFDDMQAALKLITPGERLFVRIFF
jgi:multidrug resistance efflux pump